MKKAVYAALGVTALLVVLLIGYGVYLNVSGENALRKWSADYKVPLSGARVQTREMYPMHLMKTVNMTTRKRTDAYALVDGRIEEIFVNKGDSVGAGQPLMRIVNPSLPARLRAADGEILRAETELSRAQAAYNRYTSLFAQKATSKEKVEEAVAAYDAAQASVAIRNAEKEGLLVEENLQNMTAPVAGNVIMLYKPVGTYIAQGTPLALIGDYHTLEFKLAVSDEIVQDVSKVKMELSVPISALGGKYGKDTGLTKVDKDQLLSVEIANVEPPLSEPAEIRTVTFQVDNSAGLLEPKVYRNLTLRGSDLVRMLAVPLEAMLKDLSDMDSESFINEVFVYKPEDSTIERRQVIVYSADEKYVAIESGLEEGDIVITSNLSGLREGTKVEVTLEGGGE